MTAQKLSDEFLRSLRACKGVWHLPKPFWPALPQPIYVYVLLLLALVFMVGVNFDQLVAEAVLSLPPLLIDINGHISKIGDSFYIFALSILGIVVGHFYAAAAVCQRQKLFWLVMAQRSFYVFAVNATSGLFSIIAKNFIGRARPGVYDAWHFEPFTFMAKFASTPSGHSITAFATAYALAQLFPRARWWLWLVAGLVGLSRIIIHAHFISDVLIGAGVGVVFAYVVTKIFAAARMGFDAHNSHISPRGQFLLSHVRAIALFGVTS